MTAPVGEVTTPMTEGRKGSGFLRPSSNSPSAASRFLRSSSSAISAPTPAGSSVSMTIWYFDCPGKVLIFPATTTSSPCSGLILSRGSVVFHTTADRTERSSLRSR